VVRGWQWFLGLADSAIPSRSVKVLVESRLANSRGGALAAGWLRRWRWGAAGHWHLKIEPIIGVTKLLRIEHVGDLVRDGLNH